MSASEHMSLATRSECSRSSKSSRRSSKSAANLAALEARAKAEAALARASYAQREIEVKVKKAQIKVEETRLEATLEALQQEKEAEAALAEANVFETAVDAADMAQLSGVDGNKQGSSFHSLERTEKYIQDQQAYVNYHQPSAYKEVSHPDIKVESPPPVDHLQPHDSSPSHNKLVQSSQPRLHSLSRAPTHTGAPATSRHPTTHLIREHVVNVPNPTYRLHTSQSPRRYADDDGQPHGEERHESSGTHSDRANVAGLAKILARRNLLTAGLTKFNDKPENYWAWKSTFSNAVEGLDLKPTEELDLLIKWLGPESAEHVRRMRSVHVNHPAAALSVVWQWLEECYGSAEAMETAFNKPECFPKISNKDPQRLRELGDLLLELEAAKAEGYLPGLSYLDTARGIKPILEKLPFSMQEKWMSQGTRYKQEHGVSFPPFSFFSSLIRAEAKMRNDPSFITSTSSAAPPKGEKFSTRTARAPITVHKTEVDNAIQKDESKKDDPNKQCPIHKKLHPLRKCRGFREKPLEERKTFLRENSICFRCVSSTAHQAKNCKAVIQCSECESDKHIAALHAGPAPWSHKDGISSFTQHGGEEDKSPSSPVATSTCTEVCGDSPPGKSCSKICRANVYPEGHPEKKMRTYAVLDDQSNKSLARSAFFKIFNVANDASPYTFKTCSGISETVGRRA
ncbi:uncharacterized protein LOC117966565 isoform X2 [Acipenser ruthenus]|uniref:uncharacterized protein LOC117966565 isoform X2 n=1 Tax=Acipenser ruthenus TaxID=7906 RepID=UPI001560FE98|nr:uncharacterized protein LOC117966565 isoform X2 [Acipenser ruthenus]